MSPFTVLQATGAVSTEHGATLSIQTPSRARVGLALLAFIFWPSDFDDPTAGFADDGWTVLRTGLGDNTFAVLHRVVTSEEQAFYTFSFTGSLDVATGPCIGALLLVGGCPDITDVVDLESHQVLAGGPVFTATLGTLQKYSDAAFSVFYAPTDDGWDDSDAKTVIEVHGTDTDDLDAPVGGSLLVLWEMPEAAGPFGNRDATLTGGSPINATVGQVVIAAQAPEQAPRWERDDVTSIGLPTVGV